MRTEPHWSYSGYPCSFVATGCAYEDYFGRNFCAELSDGIRNDTGYLTLDNANRFIRKYLPVKKKVYYKRAERFLLKEFLATNESNCLVCVLGHLIYVTGHDYKSFFDNEEDPVVCIWYLKDKKS